MTRRFALTALALSASLLAPPRPARADDPLPKGEAVLEQYVEATGGREAYEKIKNRVAKGTMEISGAGIKGKLVLTTAEPDKLFLTIDLPNVLSAKEGTDGKVVWSTSTIEGEKVLEGEEKEQKLEDAVFNSEIKYKDRYKKIECVALEDVEGKPAYKLEITPKSGKPFYEWYDKASHLQVKSVKTEKTAQGEITAETYVSDYKKFDGILMPTVSKVKVAQQELVLTFEEVKSNVDLPADTFKIPAEVQELVDKKK